MNIKKLNPNAIVPTRGSDFAAGLDLYACLDADLTVAPGEITRIGTGFAIACPAGYFAGIFARSGLATKQGLRPTNCVGVVDSDYRGEVIVALYNDSKETRVIKHGDRVAQMILIPYAHTYLNVVDELSETDRGDGGFGSTGK